MNNDLPLILGSGKFESKKRFRNRKETQKRKVNCYEIELFCDDGGVSHVNDRSYSIHKGNLLIAHPGDVRYSELDFSCLYIHTEINDSLTTGLLDSVPRFFNCDLSSLSDFFIKINQAVLSFNEYDMLLANSALFELIYTIREKCNDLCTKKLINNKNTQLIDKSIEYMQNHYQQKITIDDIAKSCNLSVSYFYKIFSEIAGITPNEYLKSIRIAQAKKLLITTDYLIDVIAQKCGYASQVYFTYSFKNSTGISPGKFRTCEKYPI